MIETRGHGILFDAEVHYPGQIQTGTKAGKTQEECVNLSS